jgi:heme oxygenase
MPFYDDLVAATRAERAELLEVAQLRDGLAGRITAEGYVDYLTQAYHHVRHTVPLLRMARDLLEHKPMLAAALDEYIEEEHGHERWVLADIAAAGANAGLAASSAPRPATAAMVRHVYESIANVNPVCVFGMVFVLEGTSVALATRGAAAIQASLDLPDTAFTYLSSHGELDQEHLRFFARLMNSIDDREDRRAIVTMARQMYGLFADLFRSIDLGVRDAA